MCSIICLAIKEDRILKSGCAVDCKEKSYESHFMMLLDARIKNVRNDVKKTLKVMELKQRLKYNGNNVILTFLKNVKTTLQKNVIMTLQKNVETTSKKTVKSTAKIALKAALYCR